MSLESSKTLSGVGAILIAVGSFTSLSGFMGILSLIGIILVLIGMKGLADFYGEKGIFDNALYGFIFGIIGVVVAIALFVTALLSGMGWSMGMMSEMGKIPLATIGGLLLGWITFVVFVIVEAIFYRKAFSLLSEKSGEKMFDTAGLILLIGAVLTIILIGAILTLIAWILAAVAFFSIKPPPTTEQPKHLYHSLLKFLKRPYFR